MSHHIIEAAGLRHVYPDGTVGLDGVSFRITHGESVALVGENGAGKSTLLLHMSGCLFPSDGTLRIGDCAVNRNNIAAARRAVGMVFQNSDDQLFMPTVIDDVLFGLLNRGLPETDAEKKAVEALETVGAAHLVHRPPYNLSQGEKKAVAIATVLAMTPDILVMDEPAASLDPLSRRRLIGLLKTFRHTKIIATHDLDLAMDLCERTIIIHRGQVTADGPTGVIFGDEELLRRSNLEKPLSMQGYSGNRERY